MQFISVNTGLWNSTTNPGTDIPVCPLTITSSPFAPRQPCITQDQLAAMVAEEEDESGGNTDEADEAGEGSDGSEDEDEDEDGDAEKDGSEDGEGGKSAREDKGGEEGGKKGKNRTAWTELAQVIPIKA